MPSFILSLYEYLINTPANYWFWLSYVCAPALVLAIHPQQSLWLRISSLLFAFGCTYVCFNLSLGTHNHHAFEKYTACQNHFPDSEFRMYPQCVEHLHAINDSRTFFMFALGWLPAAGYVGLWELVWRIYHRSTLRNYGKSYSGRWLGNLFLLAFCPLLICAIGLACTVIAFELKWL